MIYCDLPMGVKIVEAFESPSWNEQSFARHGGFVAVVLNYNKLDSIRSACESALDQDFPCYEVLFLDDHSTDGSDRIMQEMVAQFSLRCREGKETRGIRLVYVRNEINQTTLGQWSVAVSISKGRWFGMFCGDDVSHLDRMRIAKQYIDKYPRLLGFCTSARTSKGEHMGGGTELLTWSGDELFRPRNFWLGCTAFWSREVLEKSFGRHNMDDFVLMWSSIVLGQGCPDVRLVWALNESTIDYSVGTGVSTELYNDVDAAGNWLQRQWKAYVAVCKRREKFGIHTWRWIEAFDRRFGCESFVRGQIRGFVRLAWMESGNWLRRLTTACAILFRGRKDDYGGARATILRRSLKMFFLYLFGPISYVACMVPGVLMRGRVGAHGE